MGQIWHISKQKSHTHFQNVNIFHNLITPGGTWKDNCLPSWLVDNTRPHKSSWLGDQLPSQPPNPTWPARVGKIAHPNSLSNWPPSACTLCLAPHHATWPITHGPDWATFKKQGTHLFVKKGQAFPQLGNPWGTSKDKCLPSWLVAKARPEKVKLIRG